VLLFIGALAHVPRLLCCTVLYGTVLYCWQAAGIPFVEPGAAMFAYIDMRQFLREPSFPAERELWTALKDEAHPHAHAW